MNTIRLLLFGKWVALFFFVTDMGGAILLAYWSEWSSCAWVIANGLYACLMYFYFKKLLAEAADPIEISDAFPEDEP